MKNRFLIISLFFIGYLSVAQETFQPFVEHYEDNLVLDNFPAISEDGSHCLIIYNEYSCCIDPRYSLQKIQSDDAIVLNEIIVSPSDEAVEFTIEKQKSIYEKVKELLESNHYYTLTEIREFTQIQDTINGNIYIQAKLNNRLYTSTKFMLSKIGSHGFCCNGGTDLNEDCLLDQDIVNVSLSIKHGMFLIETGVSQAANGCDQGPFYSIISIDKD